jgi:hypothetical protein
MQLPLMLLGCCYCCSHLLLLLHALVCLHNQCAAGHGWAHSTCLEAGGFVLQTDAKYKALHTFEVTAYNQSMACADMTLASAIEPLSLFPAAACAAVHSASCCCDLLACIRVAEKHKQHPLEHQATTMSHGGRSD